MVSAQPVCCEWENPGEHFLGALSKPPAAPEGTQTPTAPHDPTAKRSHRTGWMCWRCQPLILLPALQLQEHNAGWPPGQWSGGADGWKISQQEPVIISSPGHFCGKPGGVVQRWGWEWRLGKKKGLYWLCSKQNSLPTYASSNSCVTLSQSLF